VPLNILAKAARRRAALDWVTVDHSDWARIKQHVVTAYSRATAAGSSNCPAVRRLRARRRVSQGEQQLHPVGLQPRRLLDDNAPARDRPG
jgi:hypothetical protein